MTATNGYLGSNAAAIIDTLTVPMSSTFGTAIECRLGEAEEARVGAPPRCIWVPPKKGTRKYSGTAQQREDLHLKSSHDVAVLFQVHLWGANYNEAEQLEIALEAALYNTLSGNAYDLGPEAEQWGDSSPTGQGTTFLFVVPVRLLRIPLPVIVYRTTTVTQATANATVTDPLGGTPTTGSSAGTVYP
jgi:hypothetical protein